jgi:hypothetical protein
MKFLLSILMIIRFLSDNNFEKGFSKLSTEQMAEVLKEMIGKELPRRLDEITVAKETFSQGKIYGMKKYLIPQNKKVAKDFKPYLVSKLYEKQSFYDFMKRSEVANMCKSRLIKMFLYNNGQVKINYYNQEEENILFVLLNKKDCK